MDWAGFKSLIVGVRFDRDLVPVILPEPLRAQVLAHLRSNDELSAVRWVRQRTGLDLRSAVRAVRAVRE